MNSLDKQYQELLLTILEHGVEKEDRTGTGTRSIFGYTIRHSMSEGFPALTTKKLAFKTMVTELLWFLKGDTNIKYLVDNGCNIWNGDAYKRYSAVSSLSVQIKSLTQEEFINQIKTDDEFAKRWGELGPIYGKQWRNWMGFHEGQHDILKVVNGVEQHKDYLVGKDQIWNLINELKTNPDSRRLMVNAWNVGELDQMVLPPCHYGFQVYTRELSLNDRMSYWFHNSKPNRDVCDYVDELESTLKHEELNRRNIPTRAISLMYNARSQDVPLGTPFNIASYALLLEIIGRMVNMVPDELITNMGDCHIYKNQVDGVKEQLIREPYPLPKLVISDGVNFTGTIDEFLNSCSISDFKIEGYQSHPTIKMPLSN